MRKHIYQQAFPLGENLYYFFVKALISLMVIILVGCANTDILPYTTKVQAHSPEQAPDITITFLGNTTLYIKDNNTKGSTGIFIDAFVSRPNYILSKISHNKESNTSIDDKLENAGIKTDEVGWVIPLHSHFDHLLDAPYVANKSQAKLVATPTTKNIATSMGYNDDIFYDISGNPEQKITIEAGAFTVELEPVVHSDTGIAGKLFAPVGRRYQKDLGFQFKKKNKACEYVEGQSYNVHIIHNKSKKTIYVLGGFPLGYRGNKKLPNSLVDSDIVFVAAPLFRNMSTQDRDIFWIDIAKNEKWVIPVHWDVFDRPLDIEQCQGSNNLENCLKSFFPLKGTMIKIDKELGFRENIHLRWLTAFGKVTM